jgi:hypothetical protein
MITRRSLMLGSAATFSLGGWHERRTHAAPAIVLARAPEGPVSVALDVAERQTALPCFKGKVLPLWTFQDGPDFPVVRLKAGQRFEAVVKNSLTGPGSM